MNRSEEGSFWMFQHSKLCLRLDYLQLQRTWSSFRQYWKLFDGCSCFGLRRPSSFLFFLASLRLENLIPCC